MNFEMMGCPNPVFVCGCPRSGTTALWNALVRHPHLGPAPGMSRDKELWFFEEFFSGRANDPSRRNHALDQQFEQDAVHFINSFMTRNCASPTGRYVSGNLQLLFSIKEILRHIPDAKFLLVLRHPQENVWSLMNVFFAPGWIRKSRDPELITEDEIAEAARLWKKSAQVALAALAGEYGDSVAVVRQEQMVLKPTSVCKSVLRFIDEPYETAVVDSLSGGVVNSSFATHQGQGESSFYHVEEMADDQARIAYFDKIRAKLASRYDVCSITRTIAAEEMKQLEYEDYSQQQDRFQLSADASASSQLDRAGEIVQVSVRNSDNGVQSAFGFGQTMHLNVTVRANRAIDHPSVSFVVRDGGQNRLFGTTTFDEHLRLPDLQAGERLSVNFQFDQVLKPGRYFVLTSFNSVSDPNYMDNVLHHEIDGVCEFDAIGSGDRPVHYTFNNPVRIDFQKTDTQSSS